MPRPSRNSIFSCLIKVQQGFTFLLPAYPYCHENGLLNRCVYCLFCAASSESDKTHKELGDTVGRVGVSWSHSSSAGTERVDSDRTAAATSKRRNCRREADSEAGCPWCTQGRRLDSYPVSRYTNCLLPVSPATAFINDTRVALC